MLQYALELLMYWTRYTPPLKVKACWLVCHMNVSTGFNVQTVWKHYFYDNSIKADFNYAFSLGP